MKSDQINETLTAFKAAPSAILVTTTVIEVGIDIPQANIMIIHSAERFGLAQLHQLRGRVGRSHHQAYAYLLVETEALTAQAKKRLEAIQSMEQLGSGFYLAMHDLEVRGAGEVLGESQSGEIQEVGFNLRWGRVSRVRYISDTSHEDAGTVRWCHDECVWGHSAGSGAPFGCAQGRLWHGSRRGPPRKPRVDGTCSSGVWDMVGRCG